MPTHHEHVYVDVAREKNNGRKVRRRCACAAMGPWVKVMIDATPVPSTNPVVLRASTVAQLRILAKAKGIRNVSRLTKPQLIEKITEVTGR